MLHPSLLKKFSSSKIVHIPSTKRFRYFCLVSSSASHVVSSVEWFLHSTLTIGIVLVRRTCSLRSKILIVISSYDKFSWIWSGSYSITCFESETDFLRLEIWNTLCILDNAGGKATQYATDPILSSISNGPTNLGLSLLVFPISALLSMVKLW